MEKIARFANGLAVELPPFTPKVAEAVERGAAPQGGGIVESARAAFEALGEVLGEDVRAEVVEADSFEGCDLRAVVSAFSEVRNVYLGEALGAQLAGFSATFEALDDLGEKLAVVDRVAQLERLAATRTGAAGQRLRPVR